MRFAVGLVAGVVLSSGAIGSAGLLAAQNAADTSDAHVARASAASSTCR